MTARSEIRWELLRCTGCGHERPRQHSIFRGLLACPHCRQPVVVLPMLVLEMADSAGEEYSPAAAAAALLHASDQERDHAIQDPDVVRRSRREGRAEAFSHAAEMVAAANVSDPLRTAEVRG